MSKIFNIFVYTASHKKYAEKVIESIDPEKKYFVGAFYRNHCLRIDDKNLIKDLKVI
jgi:TFIIF-interacting CTD phosphatase-like protein